MTQQDDITQRELTAEHHLNELMRLTQPWPNATIPCATVRSHVEQALSQVRAPVADERAADTLAERFALALTPVAYTTKRGAVYRGKSTRVGSENLCTISQAVYEFRAALASAPVADVPLTHRCANCGAVFQGAGCPSCRLAAPVASAPVAEPGTMEEIHRQERERSPWVLPKDPTLPDSAPVAGEAQKPVAWFIDWPDEPELGHYIAESAADSGRNRPLVFADASPRESTPVPEGPVYAYRRKGLDDFVTCDRKRFDELSAKPRLFETRIFYAAPQASPVAAEAQPSRQTLLDAIWRHGNARAMAEHNIAYRDEVRNTADALIALFDAAPQASAEDVRKPIMTVAEFCTEADRIGLTADTLAAQLAQRPEFADCLPQADKDGGQQREGVVTDDMRHAVRFAPSSAHWSERLVEFFGPDAREGIDALERQLREARAALSAPQAEQGERDAQD